MNTIEFASLLAEWRERNRFTDAEAAAAVGARYGAFLHWLNGHYLPHYFTQVAVLRQIRDGRDPLVDVRITAAEFANTLKNWRAAHGFSQRQAAIAIGTIRDVIGTWEQQEHVPQQPALAEIIRRLRMPVDDERVKLATKRQPVIEAQVFAARLREWRRRRRLTQAQAGQFLSTTARTIWVWEKARSLPNRPLAVLAKLAECPPPKPKPFITPLKFGRLLREWRKRRRLNQLEAAAELGVGRDQAKISNWEKGKSLPRKPVLMRLLATFKEATQ